MSITYTADVFCDGKDCSEWNHGVSASSTTGIARHARKYIKKQKWGRVVASNGKVHDEARERICDVVRPSDPSM